MGKSSERNEHVLSNAETCLMFYTKATLVSLIILNCESNV